MTTSSKVVIQIAGPLANQYDDKYQQLIEQGEADGYPNLDDTGVVPDTELPAYATAAQGALADTAMQPGDAAGGDLSGVYPSPTVVKVGGNTLGSAAYTQASAYATSTQGIKADSAVQSVNGHTGANVSVAATDVGLGNVDNTSDSNKPVSVPQQAALNLKQSLSYKGIANGYAQLDSSAKLPTSIIPTSVLGQMSYEGTWDASAGTAPSTTPDKGQYWIVSVAGSTSLSGITDWKIGDWAVYGDTVWQKVDNTDAVSSVAGLTGVISAPSLRTALSVDQVDNTSDSNKPVSTAQQAALNLKLTAASNLSDVANVATARTNLALGTMATQNANSVAITGGAVSLAGGSNGAAGSPVATQLYIASRGTNLITNGFLQLGNTYNWPGTTLDLVNVTAGFGSIRCTGAQTVTSTEAFAVDTTVAHTMRGSILRVSGTGGFFYIGLVPFDSAGSQISPYMVNHRPVSDTTLAAALNPGDTAVSLTDGSGWTSANAPNTLPNCYLAWYPYTDPNGRTYPNYSYTRNTTARGIFSAFATSNSIPLVAPWAGPVLASGTPVSLNGDASTYLYTCVSIANPSVGEWTSYSGTIGPGGAEGLWDPTRFPAGAASFKVLLLGTSGVVAGQPYNFGALSFT